MQPFERSYEELVRKVLVGGEDKRTRNGETRSLFGETLTIHLDGRPAFPLLQGRRIYYKGVLGEFAAMLRKPTCVEDFEKWGCNYWKSWAKEDGSLVVDYGNAWHANGQLTRLLLENRLL